MREELLGHVTSVYEEEVVRLADEQAALQRTAQRFGNPTELTGQTSGIGRDARLNSVLGRLGRPIGPANLPCAVRLGIRSFSRW
jgi:hypothetical protein